jgi:hypothetical protein
MGLQAQKHRVRSLFARKMCPRKRSNNIPILRKVIVNPLRLTSDAFKDKFKYVLVSLFLVLVVYLILKHDNVIHYI